MITLYTGQSESEAGSQFADKGIGISTCVLQRERLVDTGFHFQSFTDLASFCPPQAIFLIFLLRNPSKSLSFVVKNNVPDGLGRYKTPKIACGEPKYPYTVLKYQTDQSYYNTLQLITYRDLPNSILVILHDDCIVD